MRALVVLAIGALASACTDPCKHHTGRVTYTLSDADDANAASIDVTIVNGGNTQTKNVSRQMGDRTIEIDFSAYPENVDQTVNLVARTADSIELDTGRTTVHTGTGCFSATIDLTDAGPDLGANVSDLGDAGEAPDDFAGEVLPDLAIPAQADLSFAPQTAPSCTLLSPNCGATLGDSCCTSPLIAGGTYYRSHDYATDNMYPSTSYPATVSSFRLDKYEVTVGRYRKFLDAGKGLQGGAPAEGDGANPYVAGSGWQSAWDSNLLPSRQDLEAAFLGCTSGQNNSVSWTHDVGAQENLPINCVNWYEAFAFCAWDGAFLATEAEWNYAATGGDQQRAYPWSNPGASTTIDCAHANYGGDNAHCAGGPAAALWNVGTVSKGDGLFGQSDLAGNVYEWTLDWYGTYPVPCVNCAAITSGTHRVIRGGAFLSNLTSLRTGDGGNPDPTTRGTNLGIRCARVP